MTRGWATQADGLGRATHASPPTRRPRPRLHPGRLPLWCDLVEPARSTVRVSSHLLLMHCRAASNGLPAKLPGRGGLVLSDLPDRDLPGTQPPAGGPSQTPVDRSSVASEIEGLIDEIQPLFDSTSSVALLTGEGFWRTRPMASARLRSLVFSDGGSGVRGETLRAEEPSVCFPSPAALGATWDAGLIGRLAQVVAGEARRKGVDVILAPTVNLQRSPLAGRHFEYLSEDPLLVGRLAGAYVTSLQRCGVAATAKHYVANEAEKNRFTVDVRMDEQTLREVYLAPFEHVVTSAGVWVVMAAYNSVNGATMSENPLLKTPLVDEWGFDGVIVSDWYAARSTVASARAGLTLVMPGPGGPWGGELLATIAAGLVDEADIADKVRRLLRLAVRVGALAQQEQGDVDLAAQPPTVLDLAAQAHLLKEAAAASVVLARNAGVLPLDAGSVRQIAVVGPNAADMAIQGGGSSEVVPQESVSVLDALRSSLGTDVDVLHAVGAPVRDGLRPVRQPVATCVSCGRPGVHVRYLSAEGAEIRNEHRQDGRLVWVGDQLPAHASVEVVTRIRADEAGTWRFGAVGVGHVRLELGGHVVLDEILSPARSGFASDFLDPPQRGADLELETGEQVDVVLLHRPEHDEYVKAVLGFRPPQRDPDEELALAVAMAKAADVAVVVVGTNEEIETEGRDRVTLVLPGRQDELVQRVAEVSTQTVVVVISGGPVALPWRDEVDAVVLAPFGGQEQGVAIADVLLGVTEPGGRLATTWGSEDDDVHVRSTQPVAGVMRYVEGVDVGYRAWVRTGSRPAYWFGHGLGYTSWRYELLDVSTLVGAREGARVRVRLTNVGSRPGKEVVQVYLSRSRSSVRRPPIWLAGFEVVTGNPGEVLEVEIAVAARAFQHWSVDDHQWRIEPGSFEVTVGRSAGDRPLAAEIVVTSQDQWG